MNKFVGPIIFHFPFITQLYSCLAFIKGIVSHYQIPESDEYFPPNFIHLCIQESSSGRLIKGKSCNAGSHTLDIIGVNTNYLLNI